MGKRKTTRRRRSLRVRIYELRQFIVDQINELEESGGCADTLVQLGDVVEKMADLFDIKRLEEYYMQKIEEIKNVDDRKIEKKVFQHMTKESRKVNRKLNEKPTTPTRSPSSAEMEAAKAVFRDMIHYKGPK